MDTFATQTQNKRSCTSDALTRRSPRKKIKLLEEARLKKEEEDEEEEDPALAEFSHPVPWQKIEAEGLDCDYALLFSREEADQLFKQLEEEVEYSTGTTSTALFCNVIEVAVEQLWLFLFQGKKQRSTCLESCTIYPESRRHTETQV